MIYQIDLPHQQPQPFGGGSGADAVWLASAKAFARLLGCVHQLQSLFCTFLGPLELQRGERRAQKVV